MSVNSPSTQPDAGTSPNPGTGTLVATMPKVPPPVEPPPQKPRPETAAGSRPPTVINRLKGGDSGDGAQMGFMDHLMELRRRLWLSIVSIIVCMVLSLVFYSQLFAFMRAPLDKLNAKWALENGPKIQLTSTDPMDTLMMVMWLSIGAGLIVASPIVIYQLWAFVAPGLKEREKRAIQPVLYGGIVFFLAGCAAAYYVLFPLSIQFFSSLNVELDVVSIWTVEKYSSLLLNMMAIAGLICEVPLVVAVFAKLGLVKPSYLTKYWRICVLIAFVLGSVFSPGSEIMSMLLFTLLLLSVYLLSIFMAWMFFPVEKAKKA